MAPMGWVQKKCYQTATQLGVSTSNTTDRRSKKQRHRPREEVAQLGA